MADGVIAVGVLRRAVDIYLGLAYPGGVPAGIEARVAGLRGMAEGGGVPPEMLEAMGASWALRLGQPMYPHMKLVLEPAPGGGAGAAAGGGGGWLFRVDAHDMHLHAKAGSPDEAWLAQVRASNKALVEQIEGGWAAAGLPTFRVFLREQLAKRKAGEKAEC